MSYCVYKKHEWKVSLMSNKKLIKTLMWLYLPHKVERTKLGLKNIYTVGKTNHLKRPEVKQIIDDNF